MENSSQSHNKHININNNTYNNNITHIITILSVIRIITIKRRKEEYILKIKRLN